jgi:hypothetical protein
MAKKKTKEPVEVYGEYKCYSCSCELYDVQREMAATDFAGTLADGTRFTRVIRHAVKCQKCNHNSVLMQYEFDPEQWQD